MVAIQVGSSSLRNSTTFLDTPGSSGLQFELNNLRNELRAKQREHSETQDEVPISILNSCYV